LSIIKIKPASVGRKDANLAMVVMLQLQESISACNRIQRLPCPLDRSHVPAVICKTQGHVALDGLLVAGPAQFVDAKEWPYQKASSRVLARWVSVNDAIRRDFVVALPPGA